MTVHCSWCIESDELKTALNVIIIEWQTENLLAKYSNKRKEKWKRRIRSFLSMLVGVKRRQNPSFVEQDNRFWLSHNKNIQNNIVIYKSLWSERKGPLKTTLWCQSEIQMCEKHKNQKTKTKTKTFHLQNIPSASKFEKMHFINMKNDKLFPLPGLINGKKW